jgi:vacuolar protein sorting-associated protein 53
VSQARDDLTDAMCKKEMGVYTAIFGTTGDTAALERTDRRYLWLRKRLGSRQEVRFGPRLGCRRNGN